MQRVVGPDPEENQQYLTRKLYLERPLQGMDAVAYISQQSQVNLRLTRFPGKDQAVVFRGFKIPRFIRMCPYTHIPNFRALLPNQCPHFKAHIL